MFRFGFVFRKPLSHQCKRLFLHFHTGAPNHLFALSPNHFGAFWAIWLLSVPTGVATQNQEMHANSSLVNTEFEQHILAAEQCSEFHSSGGMLWCKANSSKDMTASSEPSVPADTRLLWQSFSSISCFCLMPSTFLGLPVSRKPPWINFGFRKSEIGEECPQFWTWNFRREFFVCPEALGKQGWKFRYQNSPSKFAEKFAGNFPKIRRTKIKNSPQIRSA